MSDMAVTRENPALKISSLARRRYAFLICVVAVIAMPFLLIQGPLAGLARDAGVVATPERFSALGLPDYAQLPLRIAADQPIHLLFSITNDEGHALTYRWRAELSSPIGHKGLESGLVAVAAGATRDVTVSGLVPRLVGADTVRISIAGQTESVQFHLSVTKSRHVVKSGSGS